MSFTPVCRLPGALNIIYFRSITSRSSFSPVVLGKDVEYASLSESDVKKD